MIQSLSEDEESGIRFRTQRGGRFWRFDAPCHGLNHSMSAVDFVAFEKPPGKKARWIFIEVKNPEQPHAREKQKQRFWKEVCGDSSVSRLARKFWDTFVYMWAVLDGQLSEASYYLLLQVDTPLALAIQDKLRKSLGTEAPHIPLSWQRTPCSEVVVFPSVDEWNKRVRWLRAESTGTKTAAESH